MEELAKEWFAVVIDNLWTLIGFVIATGLTIAGLRYARKQEKRAQAQESIGSRISVSMYDYAPDDVIDYFFLLPFKEGRVIFMPLVMGVNNKGDASADDVEMYWQVSDHVYQSEALERGNPPYATARKMTRSVDPKSGADVVQVYQSFHSIQPGMCINLHDVLLANWETFQPIHDTYELATGNKVELTAFMYSWFDLSISIALRDSAPYKKQLRFHFRNQQEGLVEAFLETEAERRSKTSFSDLIPKAREQMLALDSVKKFAYEKGMGCELDQPMPSKCAVVWFDEQQEADFFPPEALPEGREVVMMSGPQARIVETRT